MSQQAQVISLLLAASLTACSAKNPDPSPLFDGRYVGTRQSDNPEACGIGNRQGQVSARVRDGYLTMPLFDSKSIIEGTVGENGRVRGSGIWQNPPRRHPQITILNGFITHDLLEGMASDFVCRTDLRLRKLNARR